MLNRLYRYQALAVDYDGTLAHGGHVNSKTIAALQRTRASERMLVLVTGRQLKELLEIFPPIGLFDLVVAENGGLLYWPANDQIKSLAEPPLQVFVQELRARGVQPLSVGHVIVATFEPHETVVLQAIKELGLELEVIFNKGAVMVLPTGVNKATGLLAGLAEFGISSDAAVGIGDAENDHAFLEICGCGVAVQNALPLLKEHAQIVTRGRNGTGVIELIDELLATDLSNRNLPKKQTT